MPKINTYNTKAAGEALKLLGGELLMSAFLALYDSLVSAEQAGYAERHAEGYSQALDAEQARAEDKDTAGETDFDHGYVEGHCDGYGQGYADGAEDGVQDLEAAEETERNSRLNSSAISFDLGYAAGHFDGAFRSGEEVEDGSSFDWELVKAARALDEHERGRDAGIEAANASEPEDVTAHDNKQVEGFNFPEGFVLKAADIKASPLDNCPF